ncbi:MAG: DUF448 domain-containing protein [Candidatus Cloacimonas sp.]|nr:DUF448 domain-containing protein [Candidatus Cloacimonas sp.]
MSNSSSHADHIPVRTCVVCKKKVDQIRLLNFCIITEGIVFDLKRCLPGRKFYLCALPECYQGLELWKKRYHKRQKGKKA